MRVSVRKQNDSFNDNMHIGVRNLQITLATDRKSDGTFDFLT